MVTSYNLTGNNTTESPSSTYVTRLLWQLRSELEGLHRKIDEIEKLRYGEDSIALPNAERRSGLEVRVMLASELIETVKASMTNNPPRTKIHPHRTGDAAQTNSDRRERFWDAYISQVNYPIPVLSELADSQGLGLGILKGVYTDWPKTPRTRQPNEAAKTYLDRTTALKKQWGPPFEAITIHPLTYYPRIGKGNKIVESIEHSWKPRLEMYQNFGIASQADLRGRSDVMLHKNVQDVADTLATSGQPDQYIRALPYGTSTTNMSLVTEYWSKDWYQVYLDRRLIYEEEKAPVNYFIAVGRSSSSRDPDKLGLSVAEYFRQNEPVINRTLTRMAEAVDLTVRKRLTVELPEGSTDGVVLGADNNPTTRTFNFTEGNIEALPAGASVKDPFTGVENADRGMQFLQLLLSMANQHGVSPLFKGMPPGSQGSGYRDNSLYLMAKSQYAYMIDQYSATLSQWVTWLEWVLVNIIKEPIYCGDMVLRPSDVDGWPATVEVVIEPLLPQNQIAEGQFYSNMWKEGHIPRRIVLEDGIGIGQPSDVIRERLLEDIQDAMIPALIQDVLSTVRPPQQVAQQQMAGDGSEPPPDPNNPMGPAGQVRGPGGAQQVIQSLRNGGGSTDTMGQAGEALGGLSRAGQSRQPPIMPGSFPASSTNGAGR